MEGGRYQDGEIERRATIYREVEKKRKRSLMVMISQKIKGPLLPGIRLHGLPASLDWADDRLAVHHSSLLCCCRLSHVGAKVRVY